MSNISKIRDKVNNHFEKKREEYLKKKRERNRLKWGKYYHTKQWMELRERKFLNDPCCEICKMKGVYTPTEEIHHLRRFSSGVTEEEKWLLLLSYSNLISLCSYHHQLAHNLMKERNTDYVSPNEILAADVE